MQEVATENFLLYHNISRVAVSLGALLLLSIFQTHMSTPQYPLRDWNAIPNLVALHHVPHSKQYWYNIAYIRFVRDSGTPLNEETHVR